MNKKIKLYKVNYAIDPLLYYYKTEYFFAENIKVVHEKIKSFAIYEVLDIKSIQKVNINKINDILRLKAIN